ncbi:MAG: Crp/Fnr family transcriptional regulator [Bacteroidales bacterium]|nr:Crp/Fnr family transcriptional regulator [Bacteroidales bacterium]
MDNLRAFIEQHTPLSDSDWQSIRQEFERLTYKKNSLILEEGSVCRHFYFLESGLIRFFYTIDGEDITKTFTIAPYCFTSKISFRKQCAAEEGIQALEDTVVWRTGYEQYRKLETIHVWNIFMRKILNEIQEFSEKLLLETKTLTAEARYLKLLEDYPASLIQKIPLKHLSTFLGIAPQSLSRIRKKNFNQKT